jgi:pimeloyl-ACP methyl ester carboxylesterase
MKSPSSCGACRLFVFAILASVLNCAARTWTAADGRTLEGEFVSATGTSVTIKRADGKLFTIDLEKLSEDDRAFVAEQAKKPATPAPAGPAKPPAAISGPYAEHVTGDWKQFEGKGGIQCMLFAAKSLDASKKHPLVVYLHGKGNVVLTKKHLGFASSCAKEANYEKNPCFILAPQCPDENGWSGNTGVAFMKSLKDLIKNLPIDEDRIYLIGYSMGGYGTFNHLNSEPRMFAAGIPVAGGCDPGIARNLRRIPLWIFHGEKDDVVTPDGSRAIAKALERAKAPAKYTEFPGEGHGIMGKVADDPAVHEWLFSQKRGK